MFDRSAELYDAVYSFKDYAAEAARLHGWIQSRRPGMGLRLLDVACGTGAHFPHLGQHYTVEGRDAFAGAGLEPEQDLDGLTGRGPYLATAVNQGSDRGWPISPHALF